jgi:hypothetical protein
MELPIGPADKLSAILGVTVKVAETLLLLASVAEIVFAPGADGGMVIVEENPPTDDEVTVAFVTPLYFITVEELGAKLVPVTITDVPTGPDVLLKDIAGEKVKVDDAVPPVFVAATVLVPDADVGTDIVEEKLPRAELVTVAFRTPLYFIAVEELAANPLPFT